ncbi:oxysterol-binding protein 2 [Contarinia nasturtii]|uniref:oxysterol-binding protein 2 n=1 Tax=Contarinia nasturtii TaxID=265458 RepID=UPI0012D48332|nr:oxysterol-binding protein 2 [Contarinia nasturtii]
MAEAVAKTNSVANNAKPDNRNDVEMKGFLLKWTNYIKGYQRRWFVLSGGILSYYRNQAEMSQTCRGTISLHSALIHTVDSCTFVITNGGTQTFHIKAGNEVERQNWVTALELAKAKSIRAIEIDEEEDDKNVLSVPSQELNAAITELSSKLENLRTCNDLISKNGRALQNALTELESGDDLASKTKQVTERATLFRISSNAMINACSDYLHTAESQGHKWSKMLQHERDQRQQLQEMVEQLARQHSHLEAAAHRHRPNPVSSTTSDDDENEFYDAQELSETDGTFCLKMPTRSMNDINGGSSSESEELNSCETEPQSNKSLQIPVQSKNNDSTPSVEATNQISNAVVNKIGRKPRRTRIKEKPNHSVNLWSIMKNCIGKDLSKIPMPVNFNEPISMLQRLTEDYEYTDLLDRAAACTDPCEQLAYVAAFTVSSYSTTINRIGKPFNPLLGETFECDRTDDLGWRCIAEQVSHHPPMAAMHCEGKEWACWQEFTMTSKFRGKYLQVIPLGNAYVEFNKSGNRYGWRKVTTTIHNIIVGKLWVDHHGDMNIMGRNSAKGYKCHLKFIPYSYFSKDSQRKVKGVITNPNGQAKFVVNGNWDGKVEYAAVTSVSGSADNPVYQTGNYTTIWTRRLPPPDSDKYYNFTELACQLNEMEEGVAPTDSRLRPDQRLMEEGRWEESNQEKIRLEEKQRSTRRKREAEAESAASSKSAYTPYEPLWFKKVKDEDCEGFDHLMHVYKGNYWEAKRNGDWKQCPNIF